jgi:hypothetical protein
MLGRFCKITQEIAIQAKYYRSSFLQKRWNHIIKAQDAREIQVPLPHGIIAGLKRNEFVNIKYFE